MEVATWTNDRERILAELTVIPCEGMAVQRLNLRGELISGEITSTRTDGTVDFYTVAWSADLSVEYPLRTWGVKVYVPTCPECDSPYHTDGDCRNHFA